MKIGLFSGGKDSLTACHLMQDELDAVLYCKTGVGLQENIDFVKDTAQLYGWKLYTVQPKKGEEFEDFVRKFGFPHRAQHRAIMAYLKYHPIRQFNREHKADDITFISGRRPEENYQRRKKVKTELEFVDGMKFSSPLFQWQTPDLWNYIKKNELDLCPVYETMHMSGDCYCGAYSKKGESFLLATFHNYMAKRIAELEEKYAPIWGGKFTRDGDDLGKWGSQTSMSGAIQQGHIDQYLGGAIMESLTQNKVDKFLCVDCMLNVSE